MSNLKEIRSFIKLHESKISLLLIIAFSSIITLLLIWINSSEEILGSSYRDVYFYLIQTLRFSGYSIGGYEYVNYLSPLIPFLTSILFRLDFVSETSIFTVTGIFYILGILGLYSLLKLKFNNLLSIFGAVLYAGFSINLIWVANGTLDISSVSLTILSLYFFLLAIEKDQKYFYLAFPIAILGFFAKYTAGLAIPLMVVYLLSKPNIFHNIKKYFKNGLICLILGILTSIPFLSYFYFNKVPLGFINQAQEIASTTTSSQELNNNLFYYFINMPRFIYNPNHILSYLILIIGLVGLSIGIYKCFKLLKNRYINSNLFSDSKIGLINIKNKNKSIKLYNNTYYLLLAVNIGIILISFLTASKISFVYSEIIFFSSVLVFSYLVNKLINIYDNKTKENFNYYLLMFSWFFSYLIFFSAHITKADRYFITLAPSFAVFITLALNLILNSLNSLNNTHKIKNTNFNRTSSLENEVLPNINNTSNSFSESDPHETSKTLKIFNQLKIVIPVILICILIVSSFNYLNINKTDPLVHNEKEIANWIIKNDPNYQSKIIWAERGPVFTWYLQKEVVYVNRDTEPESLSNQLINNNTTYYISSSNTEKIPNYKEIKKSGNVVLYKSIL